MLGGQRPQAVPGHRRDDDAGTAAGDDIPELLKQHRGTVQIDGEDGRRRRLRRRNAGGVDDAGDVSERRGSPHELVNRLARGDIDDRGADLESGIAHHLGCRRGILLAQVS